MRFHNPLDDVFGCSHKVRVLRFLACADCPQPLSQLTSSTQLHPDLAAETLRELERWGIVRRQEEQGSEVFSLNRQHRLVHELLLPLFGQERSFLRRAIGDILGGLDQVDASAALYGSVARGEEGPDCDVNILVVVPDTQEAEIRARLAERVPRFVAEWGCVPKLLVLSRSAFEQRLAAGDAALHAALKDSKLVLGRPLVCANAMVLP